MLQILSNYPVPRGGGGREGETTLGCAQEHSHHHKLSHCLEGAQYCPAHPSFAPLYEQVWKPGEPSCAYRRLLVALVSGQLNGHQPNRGHSLA